MLILPQILKLSLKQYRMIQKKQKRILKFYLSLIEQMLVKNLRVLQNPREFY